jgi:hypothetical protein
MAGGGTQHEPLPPQPAPLYAEPMAPPPASHAAYGAGGYAAAGPQHAPGAGGYSGRNNGGAAGYGGLEVSGRGGGAWGRASCCGEAGVSPCACRCARAALDGAALSVARTCSSLAGRGLCGRRMAPGLHTPLSQLGLTAAAAALQQAAPAAVGWSQGAYEPAAYAAHASPRAQHGGAAAGGGLMGRVAGEDAYEEQSGDGLRCGRGCRRSLGMRWVGFARAGRAGGGLLRMTREVARAEGRPSRTPVGWGVRGVLAAPHAAAMCARVPPQPHVQRRGRGLGHGRRAQQRAAGAGGGATSLHCRGVAVRLTVWVGADGGPQRCGGHVCRGRVQPCAARPRRVPPGRRRRVAGARAALAAALMQATGAGWVGRRIKRSAARVAWQCGLRGPSRARRPSRACE